MCGIVGYVGKRNAQDVLLDGLEKLEYRGYDSAGVALALEGGIRVVKSKGRLAELRKRLAVEALARSGCGIGHTRWATHGEPSDVNSHPHSTPRVSIVHNGIIENYGVLKERLMAKGYTFESETDTEVLVKLIDSCYEGEPLKALRAALAMVRGSYALAVLFRDFPDTLFAVKRESPLIVGWGEEENFIASDIPALLKYTRRYSVLEEVAHDHADIVFTTSARMHTACLKVAAQHPKTRFLNCSLNAPHPLVRTYYPRTYEVTYLLGMLAGIVSHSDKVGYVAANPVYGVPAAINAFAQGVRAVRPDSRVVLRWACLCDAAHPQDFSDRKDIEVFYSQDFREPEGTYRDYGLCRRLPDGVLQPLGLPEWRWDVFFTEIVRSVFAGTWDSAPGGRAINYWWGLKSGAERVEYPTRLNDGTMQLLKMAERQLCDGEIQVFPTESYSQGHALHHAASGIYTPKELMEMDWLEECVEGELPSYDELDAKTRSLLNINGLDNVKGTPQ